MATPGIIFGWADESTAAIWRTLNHPQMAAMVRLNGTDPASVAQTIAQLKAIKDPKHRCLMLWCANHAIFSHAPASQPLQLDDAIAATVKAYLTIGRSIPAVAELVADIEDVPNFWNLTGDRLTAAASAIGLPTPASGWDDANIAPFNAALQARVNAAIRQGIFAPLRKYLPNAHCSNFNDAIAAAADNVRDSNDHQFISDSVSGDELAPALYGSAGLRPQTQSAYGVTIDELNFLRHCIRKAPGQVVPWISGDNVDGRSFWKDSAYWREAMFHILLMTNNRASLFDANQPELPGKIGAIVIEMLKVGGGSLPDQLLTMEAFADDASVLVTALADSCTWATNVLARVTFAPGVTTANVMIAGTSYAVQPAPGEVGCWIRGPLQ